MRLRMLERGQSIFQRALFAGIRRIISHVPGPMLVMSYRQAFFGKAFARLLQHSMRNLRYWTAAETELLGAFVSKQNQCAY